jgi:hypothetical protein
MYLTFSDLSIKAPPSALFIFNWILAIQSIFGFCSTPPSSIYSIWLDVLPLNTNFARAGSRN